MFFLILQIYCCFVILFSLLFSPFFHISNSCLNHLKKPWNKIGSSRLPTTKWQSLSRRVPHRLELLLPISMAPTKTRSRRSQTWSEDMLQVVGMWRWGQGQGQDNRLRSLRVVGTWTREQDSSRHRWELDNKEDSRLRQIPGKLFRVLHALSIIKSTILNNFLIKLSKDWWNI